jgi:T5SS/PEP-CTERM-associated repeat protein
MISTYFKKIFPSHIQFFTLTLLSLLGWSVVGALPQVQAQINWNNFTGIPDPYFHLGSNWMGGSVPGPTDRARFATSQNYEVWWDLAAGPTLTEIGFLNVEKGNVTFQNRDPYLQKHLLINGSGGAGLHSDFLVSTTGTSLTVRGLHVQSLGGGQVDHGGTLNVDGSYPGGSKVSIDGTSGFRVEGNLNISNGGEFYDDSAVIGYGGTGVATVTGPGSHWQHTRSLTVGGFANGSVTVSNGGQLTSYQGHIDTVSGSTALVTISGLGSRWDNAGFLEVGKSGGGELRIESGGVVVNDYSSIGNLAGSTGSISVTGAGSQWNQRYFVLGEQGNGSLNVSAGGKISASFEFVLGLISSGTGATTVSGSGSQVNCGAIIVGSSGNGTLDIQDGGEVHASRVVYIGSRAFGVANVTGTGSKLTAATIIVGSRGFSDGRLSIASGGVVDSTLDVEIGFYADANGVVSVSGPNSLLNCSTGLWVGRSGNAQLIVNDNGRVAVAGLTNVGSNGSLQNFGGTFAGNQVNVNSGGVVLGRGRFEANGGWTNSGTMIFTSGTTDVIGHINNMAGASISTIGSGTTYFHGDVVHNGTAIETAAGSTSEFRGMVSGSGPFTGAGTVRFLGGFRPGSSPAIVSFEGNLEFGDAMETLIELGGLTDGQYDRLVVEGDLALDGDLMVSLINQHQLSFNQEYLIADIGGLLSGQFNGFGEGALLGTFGGHDLFITYQAGDGNDIAFFTAVPEPGIAMLFGLGTIGLASSFRRRHLRPQRSV